MNYTVHGILQARTLQWVAFRFSRGSTQPGIEPRSPVLQEDSLPAEPQGKTQGRHRGYIQLVMNTELNCLCEDWGLRDIMLVILSHVQKRKKKL